MCLHVWCLNSSQNIILTLLLLLLLCEYVYILIHTLLCCYLHTLFSHTCRISECLNPTQVWLPRPVSRQVLKISKEDSGTLWTAFFGSLGTSLNIQFLILGLYTFCSKKWRMGAWNIIQGTTDLWSTFIPSVCLDSCSDY